MAYVKCISKCETEDHVVFERGKVYNRRGSLVKDGKGVTVYFSDANMKQHFKSVEDSPLIQHVGNCTLRGNG